MEASNMTEKEFREVVIRSLKRMEDTFNNMYRNQEEMKKQGLNEKMTSLQ